MSDDSRLSRLSAELQARIDAVCETFEVAWQAAPPNPDIESFLQNWNEPEQSILRDELMLIEKEYRSKDRSEMTRQEESDSTNSSAAQISENTGNTFGPYRLIKKIGEGGMGEVWLAQQDHPVKRQVALKVIKTGVGSREVIGRFEAERQALAMMDHPNVARIIDAGTTNNNQPFFAMELVRGEPLNQYCDQHRLSIEQRLRLFIDVCSGVQHAHQKGIIHRDLKPGNILVTEVDGQPVPKVIDFGLAKAMETTARLTDNSLFTEIGRILGTLKYMSPEQAGLESQDIDIRTDVYALGVILYELLTGSTPLDEKSLKGQAILSVLATIREQDPAKPSSRLSLSGDSASSITAVRRTDSGSLHRILAGDLDWVVMKALEKDRTRRYDSVSSFAADVRRYLDSEPVIARPPSLNYRVRKFVGKNRTSVLAASLVVLTLVGGIIGTTWGMLVANRARVAEKAQRDIADQRAEGERLANLEAQEQSRNALEKKQIAQAVQNFLQNKLLGQADVSVQANTLLEAGSIAEAAKTDVTIGELIDRAAAELTPDRIESSFPDQPLVQAEILQTIGNAYRGLGRYSDSVTHLERARELKLAYLSARDLSVLDILDDLSLAYLTSGRYAEAIELLDQVHKVRVEELGAESLSTLKTLGVLALAYRLIGQPAKAIQLFELVRSAREQNQQADSADHLSMLSGLARTHREIGEYALAIELLEKVHQAQIVKLGTDHPSTMDTRYELATAYYTVGRYAEGIELLEPLCRTRREKYGISHPSTFNAISSLALAYSTATRYAEGISLLEEVCTAVDGSLGANHPIALNSRVNLGSIYRASGRYTDAIELLEPLSATMLKNLGAENRNTMGAIGTLAATYRNAGMATESIELLETVRETMLEQLGAEHPHTSTTLSNLAVAYRDAGRIADALQLYEQLRTTMLENPGIDHPNTIIVIGQLAITYRMLGRTAEAFEMFEFARTVLERHHFQLTSSVWIVNEAINSYQVESQFDQAEVWLKQWSVVIGNKYGYESPTYATLAARLGRNFVLQNKYEDAETVLQDALEILTSVEPDVWTTYNTQSLMGAALLGQAIAKSKADDDASRSRGAELYREAETQLLRGFEGLKKHAGSIPSHSKNCPRDAVDRLIDLYKALNRSTEQNQWQNERQAWQ